jgi:two-component system, OmpR family, KDP operon response regulator KdpE
MSDALSRSILVVDDSISIRTFLQITLTGMGFLVYEAETAEKGLATAQSAPIDAIVLDLGLPDRDGLDLLPDLKHVLPEKPIIILTVRNESHTRQIAAERGASAYLTKPFQVQELLEELGRLL